MGSSKKFVFVVGVFLCCLLLVFSLYSQRAAVKAEEKEANEPSKLFILWTSSDREVPIGRFNNRH